MQRVERATVVTHGVTKNVEHALTRLQAVADQAGVELLDREGGPSALAVGLGGDGTMLRALTRFLDTGVPVIGANFGRVGFLTAIPGSELEIGIARVFAGEYEVVSLPTLEVEVGGDRFAAVNDAVVVSGSRDGSSRSSTCSTARTSERAALRRTALRDASRLDGLQPLERRPGARVGSRRRGADVRRAAHPARAAARGGARIQARGRQPDLDVPAVVLADGRRSVPSRPGRW
jgi:hypothetical protein